jgi:hypothetical protein
LAVEKNIIEIGENSQRLIENLNKIDVKKMMDELEVIEQFCFNLPQSKEKFVDTEEQNTEEQDLKLQNLMSRLSDLQGISVATDSSALSALPEATASSRPEATAIGGGLQSPNLEHKMNNVKLRGKKTRKQKTKKKICKRKPCHKTLRNYNKPCYQTLINNHKRKPTRKTKRKKF